MQLVIQCYRQLSCHRLDAVPQHVCQIHELFQFKSSSNSADLGIITDTSNLGSACIVLVLTAGRQEC